MELGSRPLEADKLTGERGDYELAAGHDPNPLSPHQRLQS
jgi:hypothetical protein